MAAVPSASPIKKIGPTDFLYGSLLGEGAYAKVIHVRLKEPLKPGKAPPEFAVKIMSKRFIKKENKQHFVMMERNVMSRVAHPNVVKLVYTFQDADCLFMVMDICKGRELFRLIRSFREENVSKGIAYTALPYDLIRFYMAQLVSALEYLHTELKIVHRDLKPENILLTEKGHIKLTDFGTAKDEGVDDHRQDAFVGTAEYVSPEVLKDEVAHAPADLWALGCVIYQCITGVPPFRAGSEFLTFQQILGFDADATAAALQEGPARQPAPIDLTSGVGAWLERGASFGGLLSPEKDKPMIEEEEEQDESENGPSDRVVDPRSRSREDSLSALLSTSAPRSLLRFPPSVTPEARDIVLALLQPNPDKRLGVVTAHAASVSLPQAEAASHLHAALNTIQASTPAGTTRESLLSTRQCGPVLLDYTSIKNHPFFAGINWATVSDPKHTSAPFIPPVEQLPEPRDLTTATLAELDELGLADMEYLKNICSGNLLSKSATVARSVGSPAPRASGLTVSTPAATFQAEIVAPVTPLQSELAGLLKRSGISAGNEPADSPTSFQQSRAPSGAPMISMDAATFVQVVRTSSNIGVGTAASNKDQEQVAVPQLSSSFSAFGSYLTSNLMSTFFPSTGTGGAPDAPPSTSSNEPRVPVLKTEDQGIPTPSPSTSKEGSGTQAMSISLPHTQPRPPPTSPCPEVRMFLNPSNPPSPSGSSQPHPASLVEFVRENYVMAAADEAPAIWRPIRVETETAVGPTPETGPKATPIALATSDTPAKVLPQDLDIPYWRSFLQNGEEVVKAGLVIKRNTNVPAFLQFRSLERDLIVTKGGASGGRLLYCVPSTKSLREAWVLHPMESFRIDLLLLESDGRPPKPPKPSAKPSSASSASVPASSDPIVQSPLSKFTSWLGLNSARSKEDADHLPAPGQLTTHSSTFSSSEAEPGGVAASLHVDSSRSRASSMERVGPGSASGDNKHGGGFKDFDVHTSTRVLHLFDPQGRAMEWQAALLEGAHGAGAVRAAAS